LVIDVLPRIKKQEKFSKLCVETWTSSKPLTCGSSSKDVMQASNVATTSIDDNDSIEREAKITPQNTCGAT
jgi:hypothetical protein